MIFLVLYIVCFLALSVEQKRYDTARQEKQRIETGLLEAVEDTARELTGVMYESAEVKQQVIEDTFFEALYIALGVFGQAEEQEQINIYVPMLVLLEETGAFFYYTQEVSSGGIMEIRHVWSEKNEFVFPEGSSEEMKRAVIVQTVENVASELISAHNYIAEQYGLEYQFSVPRFLENAAESLEFPMLIAVVQGWPLSFDGDIVYENCVDASVVIQEVERYVVEVPVNLSETISYYHRNSCTDVRLNNGIFWPEYMTEQEAVQNFGAYPCGKCIHIYD